MKNIILSVVVVGLVVGGGFYFFQDKKATSNDSVNISFDAYSSTETSTTTDQSQGGNVNQVAASVLSDKVTNSVNTNKKSNMITIDTNYGKIVIETYNEDSPKTVNNFVTLASKGFYNELTFHRVIKGFMIQGGDPNGNGTGGPGYQFEDELNPNTASYKAGYKKGVVAMANAGPNTNGSQFFIMHQDYPLPNNYTIFGHVVSGQDVVDKIANVQVGQNDEPISPVIMKTVTVN